MLRVHTRTYICTMCICAFENRADNEERDHCPPGERCEYNGEENERTRRI